MDLTSCFEVDPSPHHLDWVIHFYLQTVKTLECWFEAEPIYLMEMEYLMSNDICLSYFESIGFLVPEAFSIKWFFVSSL